MKLKYGLGDILYNLATDSHMLVEDIKLIENFQHYCVRCLETGGTAELKAGPYDKYAHIVKVA